MTDLTRLARRLVTGTAHWTPAAWAATAPSGSACRADVLYDLVQALADLGAEAEARPARPVPRLDNDLALPDQLLVVTADLVRAGPPPPLLVRAEAALRAAHRALFAA